MTESCDDLHTTAPGTLDEWVPWVAEMKRTHRLTKCPRCGLFKVWVEKAVQL